VRTTRHTRSKFIPMILLESGRLATNVYFVIILIMSSLPFSPVSDLFNLLPLVFNHHSHHFILKLVVILILSMVDCICETNGNFPYVQTTVTSYANSF
jgi:hypothetical protein